MAMDPREYELIALSHVISRYKITGELPTINGQPFNLNEFKSQLFAGVSGYDSDININIDTVNMENTVVDCDNEHEQPSQAVEPDSQPAPDQDQTTVDSNTTPEINNSINSEKSSISGKLFQFFTKDNKNEPK